MRQVEYLPTKSIHYGLKAVPVRGKMSGQKEGGARSKREDVRGSFDFRRPVQDI